MPLGIEKTKEEKLAEIRAKIAGVRAEGRGRKPAKLGDRVWPVEGEFDEPIPELPAAPLAPEPVGGDMTPKQQKKADKLNKQVDRATQQAQSALTKAEAKGAALERYLEEGRKKHPAPSGTERALSMLIPPLAMGTGRKSRRAAAEEGFRRESFETEWERTQDALKAAKSARVAGKRAIGKLTEPQRVDLGKINRWNSMSEWMTPEDRELATPAYREQVLRGSLGKKPGAWMVKARELAAIYDEAEEQRDDRKELAMGFAALYADPVTGGFTDPKTPNGESVFPEGSEQRIWIMQGLLKNQGEVAKGMVSQVQSGMATAKRNLSEIGSLMGHSREGSRTFAEIKMRNPNFAQYATDPNGGVKDFPALRKALAEYAEVTGSEWQESAMVVADIELLEVRNKLITELISDPTIDAKEKNTLLAEHRDNLRKMNRLYVESVVDGASKIAAEVETLEEQKTNTEEGRKSRLTYLRRLHEKDVDEFEQLVPDDILQEHGGREVFVQKVTLNKDGKVVVFDTKEAKHKEIDSWEMIVPKKRHDALGYYMDRVVKTSDELTNMPRTYSDIRKSILDPPEILKRRQHGGTLKDVEYFKKHFPDLLGRMRVQDHGPDGGLTGDSRAILIKWLGEDDAAESRGILVKARNLLIPTEHQLNETGMTWAQWNRIVDRKKLMSALTRLEEIPRHPPEGETTPTPTPAPVPKPIPAPEPASVIPPLPTGQTDPWAMPPITPGEAPLGVGPSGEPIIPTSPTRQPDIPGLPPLPDGLTSPGTLPESLPPMPPGMEPEPDLEMLERKKNAPVGAKINQGGKIFEKQKDGTWIEVKKD